MNLSYSTKQWVDNYLKGRNLLLSSPPDRNAEDCDFLHAWLLETTSIFKRLSPSALKEIAKNATLETFQPKDIIFEQEDIAQKFYVVLRGTLSVLFDTANLQRAFHIFSASSYERKLSIVPFQQQSSHMVLLKDKNDAVRHLNEKEIQRLYKGDYFGQEALLSREMKEFYTVQSTDYVELIVIHANKFRRSLLPHFQELTIQKIEFLASTELFQTYTPQMMRCLSLLMRETNHKLGDCLYRQKSPYGSIRIIRWGSVRVCFNSKENPPQELVDKIESPNYYQCEILTEDDDDCGKDSAVAGRFDILVRPSPCRTISPPTVLSKAATTAQAGRNRAPVSLVQRKNSARTFLKPARCILLEPNPRKDNINICTLGPGDILCDIEAVCQLEHHLFSVVCASSVVLYEINGAVFESIFGKRWNRMKYQLLERSMQRVEMWQRKHSSIKMFCPLTQVLSQFKTNLEAKGVHRLVRKMKQKRIKPGYLALTSIRGLRGLTESTSYRAFSSTSPTTNDSSLESIIISLPQAEPVMHYRSPFDMEMPLVAANSTFTGFKPRKKATYSFDEPIELGQISNMDRGVKPSSVLEPNSSPDPDPNSIPVPNFIPDPSLVLPIAAKSSVEVKPFAGVKHGMALKTDIFSPKLLAHSTSKACLGQVRYIILHNKEQLYDWKKFTYKKKCLDITSLGLVKQIHRIRPPPEFVRGVMKQHRASSPNETEPEMIRGGAKRLNSASKTGEVKMVDLSGDPDKMKEEVVSSIFLSSVANSDSDEPCGKVNEVGDSDVMQCPPNSAIHNSHSSADSSHSVSAKTITLEMEHKKTSREQMLSSKKKKRITQQHQKMSGTFDQEKSMDTHERNTSPLKLEHQNTATHPTTTHPVTTPPKDGKLLHLRNITIHVPF